MFGLWAIIIPLSSEVHYGISVADYTVYTIIAIGLLSYLIGIVCANENVRFRFGASQSLHETITSDYYINYPFLYAVSAISLFYYFIIVIRILPYVGSGSLLAVVRKMAVSEGANELESSFIIVLLKNYIATPTARLLIAILPLEWFMGKRDKKLIICIISIFVLDILTTGGR